MSHPPASRTASHRLSQPISQPPSRRTSRRSGPLRSGPSRGRSRGRSNSEPSVQSAGFQSAGRRRSPLLTPHRQKLLWAGGAITLLAMATVLPTRVSSQAIADANCERVVKSGAEISRGQLSSLLEMPTNAAKVEVRQTISEPYCTLPAIAPQNTEKGAAKDTEKNEPTNSEATAFDSSIVTEREAYPLAFDPEAWVVLNYQAGQYVGYDFVFKP